MSSPRTTSGKSSRAASRWRKRCGMPEAGMSDTDMNGGPSFLTTREVAALLRVKERKVYDLAAAGDIPCRRVTGKLLFPRAEIEAWLARGGVGAGGRAQPAHIVAGSPDPLPDWAIREAGSGLAAYFDGKIGRAHV